MANMLKTLALATFVAVTPVVTHAQKTVKKAAQKATAYEVPTTIAKDTIPMTYYSEVLSKQKPPKLTYVQELAKSKYAPVFMDEKNMEFSSAYVYHEADTAFKNERTSTSIQPYLTFPKVFAFKYNPPRYNKGVWKAPTYMGRGSKDILSIDQGVGIRFSGDTIGDSGGKILSNTKFETGALLNIGKKPNLQYSPFKVTLVDDLRLKFQGIFHKNYSGSKVAMEDKFYYTNFAGLNMTGNIAQGRSKVSVAGGLFSELGKPTKPALMVYARGFLDKGRRMFFFGEGQIVSGGNHQSEARFGVGGRFGKN